MSRSLAALALPMRPAGAFQLDGFVVPYTSIPGLVDSFQTLTWKNNVGHRLRLGWQTAAPGAWVLQDLTELAVPR